MNIIEVQQNTPEWLQERCGRVTASEVSRCMAFLKSGKGETEDRATYRREIISEILTGDCVEHYLSRCMKEGKEREPLARAAYEVRTGNDVDVVGFVLHPSIDRAGCSPDGLVGADGLVEFKCPKAKTHIGYILETIIPGGLIPSNYMDQMQFQMACTGRQWCDFVTFDDRMTSRYQFKVIARVVRDEGRIAEIDDAVRLFLGEVDEEIAVLNELMPELPQAPADDMGGMGLSEEELDLIIPVK